MPDQQGWGLERMHTLPRTLLCLEAASDGCQPALSSLPSFLQCTCTEKLSCPYCPLLQYQPSLSQPQASLGLPKFPCWGHMTHSSRAHGLAQSAFSSVVV